MQDKRCQMDEAVSLVKNGQTLALGGMTIYRRPAAFVLSLVHCPTPPQQLTLLAFTGGLASDMLVGAGLVTTTRTCYFGLEIFGLAPMFTAAASNGRIHIIEETEASIANGLRASMAHVGFMPSRAWQGTEMFTVRPDVQTMPDPYTGQPVTLFPAIPVDVAVIHVLKADPFGNAILGGNPTIDRDLCLTAPTVILTAEEVVEKIDTPIDIPGQTVTAVVSAPHGAWPTSCYPAYPIDGKAILDYITACNNGRFHTHIRQMAAQIRQKASK